MQEKDGKSDQTYNKKLAYQSKLPQGPDGFTGEFTKYFMKN